MSGKTPTKKRKAPTKSKKMVIYKKPRLSYAQQIGAPSGKGPEWKQCDVTGGTISLPTATGGWSNPVLINAITSGSGVTNRLGRKVLMRKLVLRCSDQWNLNTMVISGYSPIRVVVVYDREPTGALPSVLDIFDVASILSNNNLTNSDRFQIIVDTQSGEWSPSTTGINPAQTSQITILCPLIVRKLNHETQWKDVATSNIADYSKGAMYIMVAQDSTTAYTGAGATRTFDYICRIRYTDN